MLRWLRKFTPKSPEQQANGLAGMIAFGALGILYLEAPPIPAGSGVVRIAGVSSRALIKPASQAAAVPQAMASIGSEPAPAEVARKAEAGSTADPVVAELQKKIGLLNQGRKFLLDCPDYTAVFSKQELVGNQLLDLQDIFLKCRHQPFSVYLYWMTGDEGREVLYVEGQNEGRMVVHGGGWKARLPSLTISPDSTLAMQESRYPVTKAGLLGTVDMTLAVHAEDLAKQRLSRCEQLDDQEFDGRLCSTFVTEYKSAASSPTYRKSITLIDKEWNVPLYTRNFGWPGPAEKSSGEELDEATLIEFYTFTDVQFRQQLASADFDRANAEYMFK